MGKARIIIRILILASNRALRWSLVSSVLSPLIRVWNNLTALQTAAVISTLVLTIGAIVEYWVKLKLLASLLLKWILRKSTPFDRCVLKGLLLHSLGPILVVLGIAGEVVFEGRTFVVEDSQEERARNTVGSLKGQAEQADEKAKKAIADSSTALSQATEALDKSEKAQESLSNALALARDARREADSFEAEIKVAKQQAADAESHLAEALKQTAAATAELNRLKTARTLNKEQLDRISSAMKKFAGTPYDLWITADSDSAALLELIDPALRAAGWKFNINAGFFSYGPGKAGLTTQSGVSVHVPQEHIKEWGDATVALCTVLTNEGLPATPFQDTPEGEKGMPRDRIHVIIGSKPLN